jgi:hypothetical protein
MKTTKTMRMRNSQSCSFLCRPNQTRLLSWEVAALKSNKEKKAISRRFISREGMENSSFRRKSCKRSLPESFR